MTLEYEYSRYLTVQNIVQDVVQYTKVKCDYEVCNMIERLLILMTNEKSEMRQDAIFLQLSENHYLYDNIRRQLKEKRIYVNSEYVIAIIRNYINEFLISEKPATLPHTIQVTTSLNNTTISYGIFEYPLSNKKFSELNEIADIETITIMLLRYACLLMRGQQWSLPKYIYERVESMCGGQVLEAFASPLNNNDTGAYCSLFPDTDNNFGSLGSFFDYDIQPSSTIICNPPYINEIMLATVQYIDKIMNTIPCVTIILITTAWKDALYYGLASNSIWMRSREFMCPNKHYYVTQDKKINAKFESVIFIFDNYARPTIDTQ